MNNFWQDKKILVAGEESFLGKYVVEKLINDGCKRENIFIPSGYDLTRADGCEQAVKGKDMVIFLGGVMGGIAFNRKYPARAFYENASRSLNLIEASRKEGVKKFVGLGSVCSYPKITPVPFKEENLWQGYPEETNASYGLAKKFMLVQSEAYNREYGFLAIHLLLGNLYGPDDDFNQETSHVIPALIQKIEKAKKNNDNYVEMWGTGSPTREFIYVKDAAEAIVLAAEKYDKPEPVNIGTGKDISIKGLVETACKLMDFNGEIRWDSSKPDGQPKRCLDVSKAEKEFGFSAKTELEKGLKETINWYYARN